MPLVITIAAANTKLRFLSMALVAMTVATLATWLVMLVVTSLAGKIHKIGKQSATICCGHLSNVVRPNNAPSLASDVQFALF